MRRLRRALALDRFGCVQVAGEREHDVDRIVPESSTGRPFPSRDQSGIAATMSPYLAILRISDFRKLWTGSVLSLLGDGATWTALAWIAVSSGGAGALTILGVCYFAPIVVGGLLAGKVVDRFSRRWLLVGDSVVRGMVMLAVSLSAITGDVALWQVYAVAAMYGLFKIVPIGIVPSVIPELVPADRLPPAIALEAVAYGAAGLLGPALGGVLIPLIGAHWVLAIDGLSYFAFAALVLSMKARLDRPGQAEEETRASLARRRAWRPVVSFILRDRVMLAILVAFPAFNVAMGMLIVTQPWLAHERLSGGAAMLGVLVGVLAGAELLGSLAAGALRPAVRPMLRIGALQIVAGAGLLLLLGANPTLIVIGELVCGSTAAFLTVSSQTVRYQRTPEELRARTMTLMRTLILGAVPLGSLLAGPLLAADDYDATVVAMALIAGVPGLLTVALVGSAVVNRRDPAVSARPMHALQTEGEPT